MSTPRRMTRSQSSEPQSRDVAPTTNTAPVQALPASRARGLQGRTPGLTTRASAAYGSAGRPDPGSRRQDVGGAERPALDVVQESVVQSTPAPEAAAESSVIEVSSVPNPDPQPHPHPSSNQLEPSFMPAHQPEPRVAGFLPTGPYFGNPWDSRSPYNPWMVRPTFRTERSISSEASSSDNRREKNRHRSSSNSKKEIEGLKSLAKLVYRAILILAALCIAYTTLSSLLPRSRSLYRLLGIRSRPNLASDYAEAQNQGVPVSVVMNRMNNIEQIVHHMGENLHQMGKDLLDYKHYAAILPPPSELHYINHFALGTGAAIDPYLTSPTKELPGRTWMDYFRHWFTGRIMLTALGPTEALTVWDDWGDCWCAPPSGKGKAQLSVDLANWIVPTHVVVEHLPRDSALRIEAMPKDMELWVQITDPQARERVGNAVRSGNTGPPLEDPDDDAGFKANYALDLTWLRLSGWEYQLNSPDNVQVFEIPHDLHEIGNTAVRKVAIRTLTTWGNAPHVCLYRLKLYGKLTSRNGVEVDRSLPSQI